MEPLLEIRHLTVSVRHDGRCDTIIRDLSLDVGGGERLGVVGESGSGKTLTALATMGLLDGESLSIDGGQILFKGVDLLKLDRKKLRSIRGREISMIFQEPLTALNPVMTIGDQIAEVILEHRPVSRGAAREEAIELLDLVGIAHPEARHDQYPHQFSGGMRQRVMIAIALACRPKLLIADEPTTALDVTIQAQIMRLLDRLQKERGIAILLISHNLVLVGSFCDRVAVMYGGDIVEQGAARKVLLEPRHPYTQGLLACLPREVSGDAPARVLSEIRGQVPAAGGFAAGCRFCDRCDRAVKDCAAQVPPRHADSTGGEWLCIY